VSASATFVVDDGARASRLGVTTAVAAAEAVAAAGVAAAGVAA